jgi:ADP-ribose diphosphatase
VGGYRFLSSAVVAEAGFLTLAEDRFSSPDGEEFVRFVVRHPGAVAAVPMMDGGRALCVRQYRAAVQRDMLELPAGKLDVPGEDPADAMARELAEEIGHRAGRMVELGRFWNSPGFCTELTHVYLALDLEPVDAPGPAKEEERHMTIEAVPLADTVRLVAEGEIADAKTIVGLSLAERWLAEHG